MQYKISTSIYVRYVAINDNTGLTDLYIIPTNPSGVDQTHVLMTHLENGLYTASFTPTSIGWWQARVHSATSAVEVYSARYYVGTTDDPNPTQDDTFTGRIGEVQTTPTINTVLGRLKDLWDKLNDLFTNGTAKVKIWDGTTGVTVTDDGVIKRLDVNSKIPSTLVSGTISALNGTVLLDFDGHKSCSVTVLGTWTGTLVVESSNDNGTTWVICWLQSISAATTYEILRAVHSFTLNGSYTIYSTSGITHYRVRASTWSTGTATVKLTATEAPPASIFATTSAIQNVLVSQYNNSTTNLTAGATFTGTQAESTLGVNGIQINFRADQQCTVYIEQAPDGTNWDISDSWVVPANIGLGITVQAVGSHFRTRVTNNGASTTTFLRLYSILCPIVECLPRNLSNSGRLKVEATNIIVGESTNVASWVGNNAPYKANMWLTVASWNMPLNYQFVPYQIQYSAGNASSYVKATKRLLMGSFNNITQAFTDGEAYPNADFASYLNIYFTADVGTSRTVTITYINQEGVAGRTTTYNMTSGAGGDKIGHMQRLVLQGTDIGVRDITNISTNGTGTATFFIYGETDIFSDSADASGVVYTDTIPLDAFLINYGFIISLQITSSATSSVDRMMNLTGLMRSTL